MKKLFPTDPAETRRAELNQSATDLAKQHPCPMESATRIPSGPMSEHRLLHDAKLAAAKRKRIKGRIGGTLALLLYTIALPTLALRALDGQAEAPRLTNPVHPVHPVKKNTTRTAPRLHLPKTAPERSI